VFRRRTEQVIQPRAERGIRLGEQVTVAVQHEADRGVPRALRDLLGRGAGGDPQRHGGMPQIMDAQPVEVRSDHSRAPNVAAEVGDPQHRAVSRGGSRAR